MSGLFAAFERGSIVVTRLQTRSKGQPARLGQAQFVWSIRLVTCNQTNLIDQMNKTDRMALYDHDDYLPPVSASKSPKLGIPSSEGIGIDLYSVYLIPWPPERVRGLRA